MSDMKFGKFDSLSAFLESYKTAQKNKEMKPLLAGTAAVSHRHSSRHVVPPHCNQETRAG